MSHIFRPGTMGDPLDSIDNLIEVTRHFIEAHEMVSPANPNMRQALREEAAGKLENIVNVAANYAKVLREYS